MVTCGIDYILERIKRCEVNYIYSYLTPETAIVLEAMGYRIEKPRNNGGMHKISWPKI